jgi:hypothetical protein
MKQMFYNNLATARFTLATFVERNVPGPFRDLCEFATLRNFNNQQPHFNFAFEVHALQPPAYNRAKVLVVPQERLRVRKFIFTGVYKNERTTIVKWARRRMVVVPLFFRK